MNVSFLPAVDDPEFLHPDLVGRKVQLMAFEITIGPKTVYLGLTISPDLVKTSEVGQRITEMLCEASQSNDFWIVQAAHKKTVVKRVKEVLRLAPSGVAILVMAKTDGICAKVLKFIIPPKEVGRA